MIYLLLLIECQVEYRKVIGNISGDDDLPPEIHVDLVSPGSPPVSARVSQCSAPEAPIVRSADSSAAISPNRVRSDSTPDILDAGPVFEVSPDTMGFQMRPMGAAVQVPLGSLPIQPGSESDCAPVLVGIVAGVTICSDGFGIRCFFAAG